MFWSAETLRDFSLSATDGDIGKITDFYFDDADWAVRYFVVETGPWLFGRRVLIAPDAFGGPEPNARTIPVSMSKQQVKDSPEIDTDKPVSRQEEISLADHYGWPHYWAVGVAGAPVALRPKTVEETAEQQRGDPHLRSMDSINRFDIAAMDEKIGHVEDFLIGGDEWHIRYLVIDTRNWLPGGKKVLCLPAWIRHIGWNDKQVHLRISKGQVEDSPEFRSVDKVDREFEQRLYTHYEERPYWRAA